MKKRGEIYQICWQRDDKAGKGKRGKRKVKQSVKMCRKRKFQERKHEGRREKESVTSKGGGRMPLSVKVAPKQVS